MRSSARRATDWWCCTDELTKPAELISIKKDGSDPRPITHLNDARCSAIEWGPYEQFSFQGRTATPSTDS